MMKILNIKCVLLSLLVQILWITMALGQSFSYSLGNKDVLMNEADVPVFPWFPDGHISVLAEADSSEHIMYWSEFENYRTFGDFPFPEFQYTLSPEQAVFGGRREIENWDNGGSWLMSVFRQAGDQLIGFYHAEDHWVVATNPEGVAWKSIGRTTSNDNGVSWSEGTQIITSSATKPQNPTWGGAGDNCVIWDSKNNRWLCYYQEHWLMMAVSYDLEGKPGTWYKYYNGEFSQPGLGGESSAIPGLMSIPGGNPSVHYNSYLERYVMVWHSWGSLSIYISTSTDGVDWEQPRLLESKTVSRRAWYPTIIGKSDTEAGKIARLYYADIAPGFTSRDFVSKALVFDKEEEYQAQTDWQYKQIGEVPVLGLMDKTNEGKHRIVAFYGSIDNEENIEYYYKHKEGAYVISGKVQLDGSFNEGSVGLSVRSGLNVSDAMAAVILTKDSLTFCSREKAGDLYVSEENSIEWTSDIVWLQIEKKAGTVTCRYSSTGEDWTDIGNIPFDYTSSKPGFFSTGSPENGTIAYIEEIKENELVQTQESLKGKKTQGFSNPVENQVFILNSEEYAHFSIYDLDGKLQLNGLIEGQYVNVEMLKQGLYILSLQGKKKESSCTGKLVILK